MDDANDPDKTPEWKQPTGEVRLTASVPWVAVDQAVDESDPENPVTRPMTVALHVFIGTFDSQGHLIHNGSRGIEIPASDSPFTRPQNFTWTASYVGMEINGVPFNRTSHSFVAPANGVIDLTTVAPVPQSQGVSLITGPKGDSAFKTWLLLGNVGTEEDFIESLRGPKGDNGEGDGGVSADLIDENGVEWIFKRVVDGYPIFERANPLPTRVLSGVLVDGATGEPIVGVGMQLRNSSGAWMAAVDTYTDDIGQFDFTVESGSYAIFARASDLGLGYPDLYFDGEQDFEYATMVGLSEDAFVTFTLSKPSGLRGRITDTDGSAVPYVSVTALRADGNFGDFGQTDSDGVFNIVLQPGEYTVSVTEGGAYGGGTTTAVVVSGAVTVNVDLVLPKAAVGSVVGTVKTAAGAGTVSVVTALRFNGSSWMQVKSSTIDFSAPAGNFSITGLAVGTYRLSTTNAANQFTPFFWNGVSSTPGPDGLNAAVDIVVTEATATTVKIVRD